MKRVISFSALVIVICAGLFAGGCATLKPRTAEREPGMPPSAMREFRAVWIATVANIDWPSEPGLPVDEQKRQAFAMLDIAHDLNFNAIVFQVRPHCDALYASELEPWSYYLTGVQGKAPEPFYDPLAFWVEESHKRGMELHVWFNPYRAHHPVSGEVTESSVVSTRPDIVKELKGGYYWLDPAKKGTQDYSFAVVMDVVRRYNIDGVHFDDYFYPYPSYNNNEDFPDDDTWAAYREGGGKLSRNDWRRENVNVFIKRLYRAIKKEKSHVKFGLSPFGIWRPGYPESIRGFDQFDLLYADAKLWLNEGWIDYFTPQLYWPISQIPQSYPVLLGWWGRQNRHNRNIWPGLYTSRVADDSGALENIGQIQVTRGFLPDSPGNVHFSMKALLDNRGGIADKLVEGPYMTPALVPTSPWLDNKPPVAPKVRASVDGDNVTVSWTPSTGEEAFRWVVYYRRGDEWRYDIHDRDDRSYTISPAPVEQPAAVGENTEEAEVVPITLIAVTAVDRTGNESRPALITLGE